MNLGFYEATIEENDLRSAGTGTEFVYLRVTVDGDSVPIQIWLSEKAIGMARTQLRACGFEFGKDKLAALLEDKHFLAGRKVPIEVYEEDYKGKFQVKARIVNPGVSKKRAGELDKLFTHKAPSGGEVEDDIPF